ncbi:hypothetical protein [Pseudooceanicola algae]|uniref:Uncharacterized protein n=1 Tax=Pseudooceanicola algae TaxID=1537215 RepID=A0A418SHT2_9RHOB|nr:hypothetical protein [Pseudooceanicola algae]QPM90446.1 hypothetical protein PSAL_016840 [Pseudooceanicola algae]
MTWRLSTRAALLALALQVGAGGAALAHPLPGSELLLQQQTADSLHLTIRFPLEDLLVAAPDLAALEKVAPEAPLSQEMIDGLAAYLGQHLSVTEGDAPLPRALTGAHLQATHQDHLGDFTEVVTEWEFANAGTDPASVVLQYDAVMHEVRNHRANVQWLAEGATPRVIENFGFRRARRGIRLTLQETGQD